MAEKRKSEFLEGELDKLLKVKTNRKQAKQIRDRNRQMLQWMERNLPLELTKDFVNQLQMGLLTFRVQIGCPHCNEDFRCRGCAYENASNRVSDEEAEAYSVFYCCDFKFGGISYSDLNDIYEGLDFLDFKIKLAHSYIGLEICAFINPDETLTGVRREYKRMREKIRRFLAAHIEWAETVIDRCDAIRKRKRK